MTNILVKPTSHTIAILVQNQTGALARIVGLFSGRGYNIESLTVAQVEAGQHLSRVTVVTSGTDLVITQIIAQLNRLIPVKKAVDLSSDGSALERELALVKVIPSPDKRLEVLSVAEAYRVRVVDATRNSFIFEVTGSSSKIDAFIDTMKGSSLVEVSRTGVVGIKRGSDSFFVSK